MESCYSLARENDKLKSDLMQDMKEITKLEKENKNLKSDLSECECSF
jgi:regulator of replication initiation timing